MGVSGMLKETLTIDCLEKNMPATIRISLDDDQRTELARRFEETHDAEARLRFQMVLLAADGRTAPQIAPIVRRSTDTVERVLKRYRDEGPDGVPHRRRPGRPPEVPPAWETELCRVIDEDPHTVGVRSANWTTRLLAAYLAKMTGHQTSIETVRLHLHAAGYVCKRSTWTLDRRAQDEPEWAKNASGWRPFSRLRLCRCLHPWPHSSPIRPTLISCPSTMP